MLCYTIHRSSCTSQALIYAQGVNAKKGRAKAIKAADDEGAMDADEEV